MSTEIIQALGPGSHLSNLDKFASSYKTATTKFTELLQYPFLQSIVLSDSEKNDQDLRTIVADGSSRFGQLCIANISIAQQVISYSRTVPVLLGSLTIGNYAISMQPLIARYVTEASASSNGNEQFFEEFQNYLLLLDDQIALMESNIAELTSKIENANTELANANVGQVIGDLLQSLFKFESGEEGDIQIATLLNVGIETIKSSFTQLWANQQRLKDLIKGLTALKDNLTTIKILFSELSCALTGIISDSKSLLSTWTDVQTRLGTVETVDRKVTDDELKQIVGDWTKAQETATAYINVVSGSGSTRTISGRELLEAAGVPRPNQVPKVPRTKGELKMALLLTSLSPQVNEAPPVESAMDAAVAANYKISISDRDRIMKAAGPPSQTQAVLDDTALRTSGVMQQFNDLLRIPFLNQLQCSDPDKPSETINIQTMVTNYQKMYWDLQQETVPVAQDLQTYSNTVLALLPRLVTTPSANPGEVTVATYLEAHEMLADNYKVKADAILAKSLEYKNLWDNAINAVIQAVNECKTNIETWERTVDDLTQEIRRQILRAVLTGVGALLCFAAAAFLPGGMLMSGLLVTGGTALINMTIESIDRIGRLRTTINEIKAQIEIARDTQDKLEYLLPFMEKIADSLTDIAGVWVDITQGLNDVQAWNLLLDSPALLDLARPLLIDSWTEIREATRRYMNIITGQSN